MITGPAHVDSEADDVLDGFKRIRATAEAFMDKRDLAGDGWSEEAVTAIAVTEGRPHVEVVEFNRNQEGRGPNALGADYLWWWIDSQTGECFGMLVQAKRLKRISKGWRVDVTHREGKQLRDLLRTADDLEVPAVYAVDTGGLVFREPLPCRHSGQDGADPEPDPEPESDEECLPCRKMAISMVTAYQLTMGWHDPETTADLVLSDSVPVEDLVDPAVPSPEIWDLNLRELTDARLRDFLLKPQGGAREIARRIFRLVADHRRGAFSAASAALLPVPGEPIFPDVPEDSGHFPGPYYRHVLQGLRTSLPDYVEARRRPPTSDELWDLPQIPDGNIGFIVAAGGIPAGRRPPPELQDSNIAGVVLITL
jgi:hypothetical protein